MTQILLFNQYYSSKIESSERVLATMPINLLNLATYLEFKNVQCKIYELGILDDNKMITANNRARCGISDAEIISIIKEEQPKIIGLGCMYSRHYIDILEITRLIKKVDSSIKVVLGGNHATAFWSSILKEESVDFIVRGEGEVTFYELCNAVLSDNLNLENIKGVSFRDKEGKIAKNQNRELLKDLDELPMIDYSLLDIKKYVDVSSRSPYLMRSPCIGIVSSRGCPNNCVYCTVKAVWGRSWRGRSARRTVDEIELLYKNYGMKEFAFLDDSASIDKKRWNDICDEIINRKLDITWSTPNGIAYWTLDRQTLRKMKEAGCYRVTFGIESGNVETRKFLGKPYPLSQAKQIIRYANKIGMWTICTNILGFPYETKKSMMDTVRFAQTSGTDFATFYLLAPLPTSNVYEYFKKEGLLNFDFIFNENKLDEKRYEDMNKIVDEGGTPTKYLTAAEVKKIQAAAYRNFMIYRAFTYAINPLNLLQKIRTMEDFKYTIRLMIAGAKILSGTFIRQKNTRSLLYG